MTTSNCTSRKWDKGLLLHIKPFGGRRKKDECFGWTYYFKKGKKLEELIYIEIQSEKSELLICCCFLFWCGFVGTTTAAIIGLQTVLCFLSKGQELTVRKAVNKFARYVSAFLFGSEMCFWSESSSCPHLVWGGCGVKKERLLREQCLTEVLQELLTALQPLMASVCVTLLELTWSPSCNTSGMGGGCSAPASPLSRALYCTILSANGDADTVFIAVFTC